MQELMIPFLDFYASIWIALAILAFVWIFAWLKNTLGSTKLAIIVAIVIAYFTFYTNPELIWLGILIFVFATFGKEIFEKINVIKE